MTKIIFWNTASSNFDDNRFEINKNGAHYSRYLGPHRISNWLKINGVTTQVIDYANVFSTNQLIELTEKYISSDTQFIGVSSTFFRDSDFSIIGGVRYRQPQWLTNAIQYLSKKYPHLTWVAGGQRTHQCDYGNWIKFYDHCEDQILEHIGGTAYKKFDIKYAGSVFTKDDKIHADEVLPIELGRGCKFKCKFCDYRLIGKKPGTYLRDFECIKNEILYYYENFGVTRFSYVDDTVNESEEKVQALVNIACNMPFRLEWVGYCRADLIWRYPSMIDGLRKSGMRSCFFGIESFESNSAKLVGKGWSGLHGKEFLLKLKKEWSPDINFEMGFITGLPGQTKQQLRDDNKWLQDNDMNGYFIGLDLSSKKSEFSANAEKYGFTFPKKDQSDYWENGIWNIASANQIADEFRIQNENRTTLAAFSLSMFGGIGYEFSDMIKTKHIDFYTQELYLKKQKCFDDYYKNMLVD